jgi:ribosomal protein S18 acetylase RimI-like enzyme
LTTPPPFVLRMRRDLSGNVAEPYWPAGIRIRTLNYKDRRDAMAAHAVLQASYYEGGGGAPAFKKWWPKLKRDKEFDPSLCFIAEDAEGVVGICQCWTKNFVKDIAVHPRVRRRGLARALMLTAFAAFKARGAAHVDLKVREENAAAQRLYEGLSMTVVARESG